jgi:hypothetical protein
MAMAAWQGFVGRQYTQETDAGHGRFEFVSPSGTKLVIAYRQTRCEWLTFLTVGQEGTEMLLRREVDNSGEIKSPVLLMVNRISAARKTAGLICHGDNSWRV